MSTNSRSAPLALKDGQFHDDLRIPVKISQIRPGRGQHFSQEEQDEPARPLANHAVKRNGRIGFIQGYRSTQFLEVFGRFNNSARSAIGPCWKASMRPAKSRWRIRVWISGPINCTILSCYVRCLGLFAT